MRNCYTYLVTFTHPITGSVQKYYGSRTANGCDPSELGVVYTTSSWTVNDLLREHGQSAFTWEVHEIFGEDADGCLDYESGMIDFFDAVKSPNWLNGSNQGAAFSMAGRYHSPESRSKTSTTMTGIKRSEETRRRVSEAQRGKKRGPLSLETRLKMSEAHKGKTIPEEARENMRQAQLGKRHTDETKAKMSATRMGHSTTEDTKNKIAAKLKGVPFSEERKAKLRAAWEKRKAG